MSRLPQRLFSLVILDALNVVWRKSTKHQVREDAW